MVSWLFVAMRIIANPLSNVFQKQLAQRSANPIFVIAATHALLTLACLPPLFTPLVLDAGWSFWSNIVVADLLAVTGNVLLVAALQTSDLSVLGPINAYKSVLGMVLGIALVHEIPTPMGAFGVLLILWGSYFVIDRDENSPRRNAFVQFFRERGIRLRLCRTRVFRDGGDLPKEGPPCVLASDDFCLLVHPWAAYRSTCFNTTNT